VPEAGWRFSTPEAMQRQIALGLVEFRETHDDPPFRKAHLRPIPEELADNGEAPFDEEDASESEGEEAVGLQVMPSVIYKQSQVAVKYLKALMGQKVFDNPKDHEVLARWIRYIATERNALILDFFAGSAATGEATLLANAQDGGDRRCILVQLPEPIRTSNGAKKLGLQTIADVARARFQKAFEARRASTELPLSKEEVAGFRAFSLAPSNVRRWRGVEEKDADAYAAQLEEFTDTLVKGWKPEDVIWEVALREGYSLTSRIEELGNTAAAKCWRVTDADREQNFVICLDHALSLDVLAGLGLGKDDVFVCRDTALDDTLAANLALQCRLKVL
jgi:adenine-specific DNA-methyltransferase